MAQVFDLRNILNEAFKKTGVEWHIRGVLNGKGNLYTLSDDTKLISKVFELVVSCYSQGYGAVHKKVGNRELACLCSQGLIATHSMSNYS